VGSLHRNKQVARAACFEIQQHATLPGSSHRFLNPPQILFGNERRSCFISSRPDTTMANHFDIFFIRVKSRSMLVLFREQQIEVFRGGKAF